MRAALVALLMLAGCKTPEPPDSFGVDLTVAIDAASRAGLAQVLISVTGAETYQASLPASAFPDGTGKLHYVPGAHSGTLSIGATAQDGAGAKLGAGNSGNITIVDGKSVAASLSITPGGDPFGDGGAGDMGSGLKALGAMCGFDNECDSAHCVDGFCCGVASCGQCQNCGATGMCTAVTNKDDNSGTTCNGMKSCDGAGMCKDRWALFHGESTSLGGRNICGTVGNTIFFQGNSGPTKSIDITSSTPSFVTEGTMANNAYSFSYFVSSGTKLYIVNLSTGTPELYAMDTTGASPRAWTVLPGPALWRGEPAVAAGNGKIFMVGGRDNSSANQKSVYVYDILANSWTTSTDAPFAIHDAAATITGGIFYSFGGDAVVGTSSVTLSYDLATTWTNLMATPPNGIYSVAAVPWRGKLAALSNSTIRTFDVGTKMWDTTPIAAPTGIQNAYCIAGAGTPVQLYFIGDSASGTQVWKYNL